MKNKRGITLIALVITIIILLILAGITITQLVQNGLLEKTILARQKYKNAEETENSILEDYEKFISTTRDSNIEEDLNIIIEDIISEKVSFKISTKELYENAVYVFIVNNEIIDHIETNSIVLNNLTAETDYDVIVIVVESNGKIHRGYRKYRTRKENVNVFGKVKETGGKEKLSEFGITYTRAGSSEIVYDELYKLGMGSSSGINNNTFTLKINYNVLTSKLGTSNFRGIFGQFYQSANSEQSGYTAWVVSQIIVTYDNGTTSENSTEKTSITKGSKIEEPYTYVAFENNKKISEIQMIIKIYDCGYGWAEGYIKDIGLIP